MDVFKIVTERMIQELESGRIPWHRPWCSVRSGAYNRITKRPYGLINQLLLRHQGEYATFKQWSALGGTIRKGEKSEIVVFWKWPEEQEPKPIPEQSEEDNSGHLNERKPILRYYNVFHISQVDGVDPLPEETHFNTDPIEEGERLFLDYLTREGISLVSDKPNEAFYLPSKDLINLPDITQYKNAAEYYSTAFHESVHSTGHESRLNREGLKKVAFGSEVYSREELVAEIGSAALMHHIGIDTEATFHNSAAYCQSWLGALKGDKWMIVSAAGQAEKAVRFILGEELAAI